MEKGKARLYHHLTGGKLSLSKTYWWLLYCVWDGSKARLATTQERPEQMQITVGRATSRSTAKQKEANNSVKQLGVLTNPAGNFSNELERQQKYSSGMATCI
eukprot:11499475-Ditylum_brightwellii.AAC.1